MSQRGEAKARTWEPLYKNKIVMTNLTPGTPQSRKACEQELSSSEEFTWGGEGYNEKDEFLECRMSLHEP